MTVLLVVIAVVAVLWAVARFHLAGEDLRRFDTPPAVSDPPPAEPSAEHFEAVELIRQMQARSEGRMSRSERLRRMREAADAMADGVDFGVAFTPADAAGVPGEWVRASGADPDRRLLYIHGGAFTLGSPKSHRAITSKLSKIAGASVLAIDYRLMPEHRRLDCLADCQKAYRWVVDHGPEGAAPARALFVAGDSAGGNLTLALVAWVRDAGLRPPDGAVALSPLTLSLIHI